MKPKARALGSLCCNFVLFLFLFLWPLLLRAEEARPNGAVSDTSFYLKVQLGEKVKPSGLKPGDVVEGKLCRSVYWRDKELFPAGSRVRLIVDKQEQRRRTPDDHWPWIIRVFTPRHEKYPTFQGARVMLPDGREVDLRVSLLSLRREISLHAESRKKDKLRQSGDAEASIANFAQPNAPNRTARITSKAMAGPTATFEATVGGPEYSAGSSQSTASPAVSIAAGTQAKVILLESVSASSNNRGDIFPARLLEPVYSGSAVILPAGTFLEGRVVRSQRPRVLSRPGSLLLSFTAVTEPDGTAQAIDASVAGVELDRGSHTRVDPEGKLEGERPGTAWILINLGVAGGIAKAADDGTQLAIEAIVSAATDASTAGTGRIVSTCVSGLFMLTRHGRDVVLPKFTEVDISFDRPVVSTTLSAPIAEPGAP